MAFFSEIFFSTLIGRPVYSIDEKYYGVFRDFVVKRQNGNYKITKVRIRTGKGKRVLVSWKDIHSIDTDTVSLKLKKKWHEVEEIGYEHDELRLKRDFLDQQIIDTDNHRVVRVNDLKIVAVKDELFMVGADIGIRGLLRRLGLEKFVLFLAHLFDYSLQNQIVVSMYIDPYPAILRHEITLTVTHEKLKQMHPADLADVMEDLDNYERMSILRSLPTEDMAHTVEELEPDVRREVLRKLEDKTVTKVLERLAPDTATDIASELPRYRMYRVLNSMKQANAEEIRELLTYKENTAGSIMNTEYVSLLHTATVADAIERLRMQGGMADHIFYLYIVDEDGILKGVVSLRQLIFVVPSTQLASLIKRRPIYAKIKDHVDTIVDKLTKYNLIAIPVVGKKRKLEGVITVDDVLPLLQEGDA